MSRGKRPFWGFIMRLICATIPLLKKNAVPRVHGGKKAAGTRPPAKNGTTN